MVRWTLLSMCVLGLVPSVAHAGACPDSSVVVFPSGDNVPINTEIRVEFQSRTRVVIYDLGPNRSVSHQAAIAPQQATVFLRDMRGAAVGAATRRLPGTALPTVVLRPTANLRPNATYQVVVRHTRDYAVGTFTTGTAADTTAPTLRRVRRARFYRVPVRHWKDPRGPVARLWLDGVADDARNRLRVEVHDLTGAKDASDATLRAIVHEMASVAAFGGVYACHDANFNFPAPRKRARRACRHRGRTLRIGLRLIDAAGNKSALRTTKLPIDCYRTRW